MHIMSSLKQSDHENALHQMLSCDKLMKLLKLMSIGRQLVQSFVGNIMDTKC